MKQFIVGVIGLLGLAPAGAVPPVAYDWRPSLTVEVDLDRNGQVDTAQLGVSTDSIALRFTVNAESLPVIEIPIDGSQQFGVCSGSEPSIRLAAQSEAPGNALGETPQGYEICAKCFEVVVGGGDCDPLHFYWDTTTNKLSWWRS